MQLAAIQTRYPTKINHTPRSFEHCHSENYSTIRYYSTATKDSAKKQPNLHPEGEQAMATATLPAIGTPDSAHQGPTVLHKSPSLATPHRLSFTSKRNSWMSSGCLPQRDFSLKPIMMEASERSPPTEDIQREPVGPPSSERDLSAAMPGDTLDMAYFLRNTGPPTPAHDTSKEDLGKPSRKRNRNIFKKRKEPLDSVTPTAEEQKTTVFVPPEGVEQKITARGIFEGQC
jgi:hypothetical protein